MATQGYNPKKAAAYNKLRQQGLSDEAAFQQSGITDAEADNYVVNDVPGESGRGTIGPVIFGSGTISQAPTAAEQRESAQFYKGLESNNFERVDYPVKANSQPSSKTPITYTTTSTEQVSGGGSTTTISGVAKANAASRALQPSIDAKQAEIDQFVQENPSNFARSKQGLPPLSQEDTAARQAKFRELSQEKSALKAEQFDAQTPGNPTTTVVPNTTTTVNTTTFGKSSTNSDVETTAGPDPALNQEPTLDNTQVQAAEPQQVPVQDSLSPGEELVQNDAPAPVDTSLLTPAESIARAQVSAPESVDATAFTANTNTSVLGAIGVPPPVDTTVDPGNGSSYNPSNAGTPGANSFAAGNYSQQQANAAAAMKLQTQQQTAIQAQFQSPADGDWRVRLSLAPSATYLYKDSTNAVLKPLAGTNGVVFPYMPKIETSYNASYSDTALTHSNYKGYFYNSSFVGDINITGTFTAQDTREANYMLAVIHFFRSVTKMFYGQDAQRGSPPPLVYLTGLGNYQFNNHPCVVKTFQYSLPNDVDYIRTKPNNYNLNFNQNLNKTQASPSPGIGSVLSRILNSGLKKGALPGTGSQELVVQQSVTNLANSTYVPVKIEIQITMMPIQTRSQQSQQFSVKDYSSGKLLAGGFW